MGDLKTKVKVMFNVTVMCIIIVGVLGCRREGFDREKNIFARAFLWRRLESRCTYHVLHLNVPNAHSVYICTFGTYVEEYKT